jgi:hypothetical protein
MRIRFECVICYMVAWYEDDDDFGFGMVVQIRHMQEQVDIECVVSCGVPRRKVLVEPMSWQTMAC